MVRFARFGFMLFLIVVVMLLFVDYMGMVIDAGLLVFV